MPDNDKPVEVPLAAETPWEDLRAMALKEYENASTVAHSWSNVIPRAINYYFDNAPDPRHQPAPQPVERCPECGHDRKFFYQRSGVDEQPRCWQEDEDGFCGHLCSFAPTTSETGELHEWSSVVLTQRGWATLYKGDYIYYGDDHAHAQLQSNAMNQHLIRTRASVSVDDEASGLELGTVTVDEVMERFAEYDLQEETDDCTRVLPVDDERLRRIRRNQEKRREDIARWGTEYTVGTATLDDIDYLLALLNGKGDEGAK